MLTNNVVEIKFINEYFLMAGQGVLNNYVVEIKFINEYF